MLACFVSAVLATACPQAPTSDHASAAIQAPTPPENKRDRHSAVLPGLAGQHLQPSTERIDPGDRPHHEGHPQAYLPRTAWIDPSDRGPRL